MPQASGPSGSEMANTIAEMVRIVGYGGVLAVIRDIAAAQDDPTSRHVAAVVEIAAMCAGDLESREGGRER